MKWIISNIRMLLLAGAVLSAMGIGVYLTGRTHGYDKAVRENNLQRMETINENLRIKEKSDNIIRPDDAALISRLRAGTI